VASLRVNYNKDMGWDEKLSTRVEWTRVFRTSLIKVDSSYWKCSGWSLRVKYTMDIECVKKCRRSGSSLVEWSLLYLVKVFLFSGRLIARGLA